MNVLNVILLSCVVLISTFFRSTNSQNFGNFYGNRSSRPYGSDVGQDLIMGRNCQIGSLCKIASGCSMGDNVHVSNHVQIDQGTSIGSNCRIMDYANLGPYIKMGPNNMMNSYAQIKENANIGSGCIMGMYSNIGPNTIFEPNVYAGDHCQIGANAHIGENSIIQPYAMVPDSGFVGPNEMVIKTPTTAQLYQNCMPINRIPQSDVDLADQGSSENLTERVRQLMSFQKQKMETSCQGNARSVDFRPLSLVISLYLIRHDGLDQFIQNMVQDLGNGSNAYINGKKIVDYNQTNGNDIHFIGGSPKKIFEWDLENDLVELLALKEDLQRPYRVSGDTFCKTVSDVQNKQRKIKYDQAIEVGYLNRLSNKGIHLNTHLSSRSSRKPLNGPQPACANCVIQPGCSFGYNVKLGSNNRIGRNSVFEDNSEIKSNIVIGDNVNVGRDAIVSDNTVIGNRCFLDDYSQVGPNTRIAARTYLGRHCQFGANGVIGEEVNIGRNSVISDNNVFGKKCVLNENIVVGPNVKIGSGAHIGRNCRIGANASIGANAIVPDNTNIPDNGHIGT